MCLECDWCTDLDIKAVLKIATFWLKETVQCIVHGQIHAASFCLHQAKEGILFVKWRFMCE